MEIGRTAVSPYDLRKVIAMLESPKDLGGNETGVATLPPEPVFLQTRSGGEVGRGGGPACSASSTATGGKGGKLGFLWGSLGERVRVVVFLMSIVVVMHDGGISVLLQNCHG